MRIGVDGVQISPSERFDREYEDRQPARTTGTALVPLSPAPDGAETSFREPRNVTAFIAQLVATAQHAPATRARGRVGPAGGAGGFRNKAEIIGGPKRNKMRPY
jgi:hypothetical protein